MESGDDRGDVPLVFDGSSPVWLLLFAAVVFPVFWAQLSAPFIVGLRYSLADSAIFLLGNWVSLALGYGLVVRFAHSARGIPAAFPVDMGKVLGQTWVSGMGGHRIWVTPQVLSRLSSFPKPEKLEMDGKPLARTPTSSRWVSHLGFLSINLLAQSVLSAGLALMVPTVRLFSDDLFDANVSRLILGNLVFLVLYYLVLGLGGIFLWNLRARRRQTTSIVLADGYLDSSAGRFFLYGGPFTVVLDHEPTGARLTLERDGARYVLRGRHIDMVRLQRGLFPFCEGDNGQPSDVPESLSEIRTAGRPLEHPPISTPPSSHT